MASEDQRTLVWLRDDLRLDDQPAIQAAGPSPTLFVYVLDGQTPGLRPLGGASKWWLAHSLASLAKQIAALGGRLDVVAGPAEATILAIAGAAKIERVFWTRRYGAAEIALDTRIKAALRAEGVTAKSFNGQLLREPWEVVSLKGQPFSVFTPFWRAHCALGAPPAPLPAPKTLTAAPWPEGAPARAAIGELGLLPTMPDWSGGLRTEWTPGEDGALARLNAFLGAPLADYADGRNRLDLNHSSKLSPHLRLGEISPRRVWAMVNDAVADGRASQRQADSYLREIGWREFSYAQLIATPDMAREPRREAFQAFPFVRDEAGLRAWQRGLTGYPVVDAAMRELWASGTMHNRARMVAASFLVKHLLIDWREGERWFWDTLCDADPANNPASWQWVTGCGADAAPYFRIFNPVLQGAKFDPQGDYVRKWVPELREMPAAAIHDPWKAPADVLRRAGVTIGGNYPKPIVDHDFARGRALAAFASIKVE